MLAELAISYVKFFRYSFRNVDVVEVFFLVLTLCSSYITCVMRSFAKKVSICLLTRLARGCFLRELCLSGVFKQ